MVDGPQSRVVVRLSDRRGDIRRVRRRPGAAGGHTLPGGVPIRRDDRVRGLRARAVADVDLVSPIVGNDDPVDDRRIDLRVARFLDGGVVLAGLATTRWRWAGGGAAGSRAPPFFFNDTATTE